jgi:hypothetical protein
MFTTASGKKYGNAGDFPASKEWSVDVPGPILGFKSTFLKTGQGRLVDLQAYYSSTPCTISRLMKDTKAPALASSMKINIGETFTESIASTYFSSVQKIWGHSCGHTVKIKSVTESPTNAESMIKVSADKLSYSASPTVCASIGQYTVKTIIELVDASLRVQP